MMDIVLECPALFHLSLRSGVDVEDLVGGVVFITSFGRHYLNVFVGRFAPYHPQVLREVAAVGRP